MTRTILPCFLLRCPESPLIYLWPLCVTAFARTHIPHHPPRRISHIGCAIMTKAIGEKQNISSSWCQLDCLSQVQRRQISIQRNNIFVFFNIRFCKLHNLMMRSWKHCCSTTFMINVTKENQAGNTIRSWKRPMRMFFG